MNTTPAPQPDVPTCTCQYPRVDYHTLVGHSTQCAVYARELQAWLAREEERLQPVSPQPGWDWYA